MNFSKKINKYHLPVWSGGRAERFLQLHPRGIDEKNSYCYNYYTLIITRREKTLWEFLL